MNTAPLVVQVEEMTMDVPRTCGEGLALRSVLPARVSALTAAIAEVLETHKQTLELADDNAKAELTAYLQLATDYRHITSLLRGLADQMVGYRHLPMAHHRADAMLAPQIRGALANLVERERDLAALLQTWVEEDQAMLVVAKESVS
jgi:hypothetical protein